MDLSSLHLACKLYDLVRRRELGPRLAEGEDMITLDFGIPPFFPMPAII
jgi:hypothetical protein